MRRTSCPSVEMQQQIGQRRGSTADRKADKTTKCARPHKADERMGINRSIKMICEFILIAGFTRRGSYAFFNW